MKWTDFIDTILTREILVIEPYQFTPKSKERGQSWSEVALNVKQALLPESYNITQRSSRDRFNLLLAKHKTKQRKDISASGISPEQTELDAALDDLLERVEEAEKRHASNATEKKSQEDQQKQHAEEVRRMSLETYSETRKRTADDGVAPKKKRTRSTGSDVINFLRESREQKDNSQTAMLNLMSHQIELQQQQMQAFMAVIARFTENSN